MSVWSMEISVNQQKKHLQYPLGVELFSYFNDFF